MKYGVHLYMFLNILLSLLGAVNNVNTVGSCLNCYFTRCIKPATFVAYFPSYIKKVTEITGCSRNSVCHINLI